MRTLHLAFIAVTAVLALVASGCASQTPAPAPTLAPTPTVAPTSTVAPSPTASGPTAGELADQGKTVFVSHCAKCHGLNGEGVTAPPNIGPNAQLSKYNTGKGLYDYVSTLMPNDAPGTLTQQEYLQVVSYLLVQNKFVTRDTPITMDKLSSIPLTK